MGAVADAAAALAAALRTVDRLRVYTDPSADVEPPGAVIGPPALRWEAACGGPTSATFLVYVVERLDERSLENLWDRVPAVADALDTVTDAVVLDANPGTFTELPAYLVRVEVSL